MARMEKLIRNNIIDYNELMILTPQKLACNLISLIFWLIAIAILCLSIPMYYYRQWKDRKDADDKDFDPADPQPDKYE
jgi:hypothetical protein